MNQDLYQEALMAHARRGKVGARLAEHPDSSATCDNPLCGDRVTVDLMISDGKISKLGQKTRGCILTQAAAALMADMSNGISIGEAAILVDAVKDYLQDGTLPDHLEAFSVMEPVRAVKSRHDCVLIAFKALAEAANKAA